MSLLNINVGVLAYSDPVASAQPLVRLADMKWSLQGLKTDTFRNIPVSLAPGEIMTVMSTSRSIDFTGSTSFAITQTGDKMRITAALGQRVTRAEGDGTTTWNLTRNGTAMRLSATGGTIPTFNSIVVGDAVRFGSTWDPYNQGSFTILSKSSTYIDFKNDLGVPTVSDVTGDVSFFSSGPVQIGDILDITDSHFAFPNQGAFPVTDVTDTYIEVLNPFGFTQTVTGVTSGVSIYPYAYKWTMLACDHRLILGLNGDAPSTLEVEPPVEGDIVKQPGIFLKRGKVFEVQIKNPGLQPAQGFLMLAQ